MIAAPPRIGEHPRVARAPSLRPAPPIRYTVEVSRPTVVHLTAECWPFARTGGLGEAVSTLAAHQQLAGLATAVVMPLYRAIREAGHELEPLTSSFAVHVGGRVERVRVVRSAGVAKNQRVFFIEHPDFSDRAGLYGENGTEYADNARRFALFNVAALTALPRIAPATRVLHAHDWHAALAPVYLRTTFGTSSFHRRLASVLSVHNAGFQGHFHPETLADIGLPQELYDWRVFEWYGRVNLLKGGMAFADTVATVSPTHAKELRTETGGFGLHGAFDALGERLIGVLNGIDQTVWNPARDPHIPAHYTAADPDAKRYSKAALQRAFGLPERPDLPIVAMCARLAAQKGLDLLLGSRVLTTGRAQFIFFGQGEERYRRALADHAAASPERIAVRSDFGDALEHLLIAGADLLLVPSVYEPCGLTQMRAQRYGTIPIGHHVGGLADTIEEGVTGFLFHEHTHEALERAVARALGRYADIVAWTALMRAAMARDFAWERSVAEYRDVYRRAITLRSKAG
jgi:starch synthase